MLHGLKYDFIEDLLINLRLLKPPPAVLAENGVMRYRIGQRKTNKPTVGDVDPDFLNEASFRTNSVQITDQKHFEQHDRIDARTPIILTIQGAAFFRDKRKVDGFIDFSKQVILGNKVFYVDCFGLKFPGWVRPEHIKTFLRNCFIPNSTKKAVDPSLSTASGSLLAPLCCFGPPYIFLLFPAYPFPELFSLRGGEGMIRWELGRVEEVLEEREEIQRLKVRLVESGETGTAVHYPPLLGRVEAGDEVWLNATAVRLSLGTGGNHFVGWVNRPPRSTPVRGHIMKLRYTPWQIALRTGEEQGSPHHEILLDCRSLEGAPVLIGELHSMLPVAVSTWRYLADREGAEPRIVYVMTDGG